MSMYTESLVCFACFTYVATSDIPTSRLLIPGLSLVVMKFMGW